MNIIAPVLLAAGLQAIVLGVYLLVHGGPRGANRYLGVLLLCVAASGIESALLITGWIAHVPFLIGTTTAAWLLAGPLLFLHTRTLSDPTARLTPEDVIHFVPAALLITLSMNFYTSPVEERLAHALSMYGSPVMEISLWSVSTLVLMLLHILGYYSLSLRCLRSLESSLRETHAGELVDALQRYRSVSRPVHALFAACVLLVPLLVLAHLYLVAIDVGITVALVLHASAVGYVALRVPADELEHETAAAGARYQKSRLCDAERTRLLDALQKLMAEEKPYLDRDLRLADLSERLGVPNHKLSQVLNVELGVSFYDFINGYRVQEAERRIADPSSRDLTLVGIASDVGFRSKSSFYRTFKRVTGKTPAEYQRGRMLGGEY